MKNLGIAEEERATISDVDTKKAPMNLHTRKSQIFVKAQKKQQYQLVADEIASVLNGEEDSNGEDDDEKSPDDEASDAHASKAHMSRRTLSAMNWSQGTSVATVVTSPGPEGVSGASASSLSPEIFRRKRRRRVKPPQPFLIKDAEFSTYSLFDIRIKNQQQHQSQQQPASIYSKTYHPSTLFTPILAFLSLTFVLLVVIRILASLITVPMGMALIMFTAASIFQECLQRPDRLLYRIHRRPCQMSIFLATIVNLLRYHGRSMAVLLWNQLKEWYLSIPVDEIAVKNENEISPASWVLKVCLASFVHGIPIGWTWRILFGTASNPTQLAHWIVHRMWKRFIRPSFYTFLRSLHQRNARQLPGNQDSTTGSKDRKHKYDLECMICLEPFLEKGSNGDLELENAHLRQYLPCLHGFHGKCLMQWLHIKSTCPICRVQVPSTMVTTLMTTSGRIETSNRRLRTHPATREPLYPIEED